MSNPIYDLMYRGESGAAGYDAYNRGTYTDANGKERIRPGDPPMDFSKFTLGEIQDLQHLPRQDPDRVFAIGKYQIIPSTMDAAVARLGIDRNEPFSPELQDRIFTDYLLKEKQPAVRDYIMGVQGATLEKAQYGLATEWASFGDPYKGGRSHYGGANQAHITLEQSADALNQMRRDYATAVGNGMSPDEAWRAATAVDPAQHTPGVTPRQPETTDPLADGLLRRDEKGEAVRTLQQNLGELGYLGQDGKPLVADGHFGANTEHAVRAYQQANGLRVDGIAGAATLGAIEKQLQEQRERAANDPMADGMLRRDEKGEAVRTLQQNLGELGYLGQNGKPLVADGHFGANTEHAVRAYQRDHGLGADGIAGPLTLGSVEKQLQEKQQQNQPAVETANRSVVDDLLDSARNGADAIREATERLKQSSFGESWQRQVAEASTQQAVDQQQAKAAQEAR